MDLTITHHGETILDGEIVQDETDAFSAAIALAQDAAARADTPLLIRVTDETAGGDPSWLEVDASGAIAPVRAPEETCEEEETATSAPWAAQASPSEPGAAGQGLPDVEVLMDARSSERAEEAPERAVAPAPRRRRAGRAVVVGAACALGVAVLAGGVWAGVAWVGAPVAGESEPTVSAAPAASSVVTLPGFGTDPTWSTDRVSAAAAVEDRVIEISGITAALRDTRSGDVLATADLTGETFAALSGSAFGTAAVAAVSDTQALVWIGTAVEPVPIDLTGGRQLTTRTGTLVVVGTDRSFELVTSNGPVPVSAPRPEMIVLGVADGAVVWAGSPHQVVTASPNGTPLREITLQAPEGAATITPKVGWVRAATGESVVVGWTLPNGTAVTGVHSAATGELLAQIPGAGDGFLSPDGAAWVTDGQLVDLPSSASTALPEGFVASQFLGDILYGAVTSGANALLPPDATTPKTVDAATVRAFAIADTTLLTLTQGVLAAFPSSR
jgi:hypothetical protein